MSSEEGIGEALTPVEAASPTVKSVPTESFMAKFDE
jgi:hypothetical protein